MRIIGYTSYANFAYDVFKQEATNNSQPRLSLLYQKMMQCDYEILLISQHPLISERLKDDGCDSRKMVDLHSAWVTILGEGLSDKTLQDNAWAIINEMGETLLPNIQKNDTPFFRKFRNDPTGKRYFVLLNGHEPDAFLAIHLNFLCNLWQIENGFTPIHSASVIHDGRLFLFCGPSGAGKSTIAKMSEERNDFILDEDILLIPPMPARNFNARAWGYSLRTSNAPLFAIFKIVQGSEDRLVPLTQTQNAHFLVERSVEILGYTLQDHTMGKLFKQIANIARCVPGYELHFRKSPDFWKLIDGQITC